MAHWREGRWLSRCAAAVIGLLCALPPGGAQEADVDLALVLAVDCSFSVDTNEFRLQMDGLGRAFMSAAVKQAIRRGNRQRIAVTVMQWSDQGNQMVVVPWTVIADDADADGLGLMLMAMPRRLAEGGTSISSALAYAAALFTAAPTAERRVVDLSSDGRNNVGPPVAPVRNRIVGEGVTINGLTILNEWPTLDIYFEQHVVGGPAHFVITANDYRSYGEAIYRKLLREITGPGIS